MLVRTSTIRSSWNLTHPDDEADFAKKIFTEAKPFPKAYRKPLDIAEIEVPTYFNYDWGVLLEYLMIKI